jgi:uncharacterized protein
MTETVFVWDEAKNLANQAKHRISFQTASRVFADPFVIIEQDRIENGELRWQAWGMVDGHLFLLVAFVPSNEEDENAPVEVIRIISARKAAPKERRHYENKHQ